MLNISAENVMYASVQWILPPRIMCFDSTALKKRLVFSRYKAQNPQLANAYRKGKTAVLQALVGRGMAQTQGRADPEKLAACLIQFL